MKKIFFTAALLVTVVSAALATTGQLKFRGADKFMDHFPDAANVAIKAVGEFTKVSFKNNGVSTDAFYSTDGELTATSHPVDLKQIPVVAMDKITRKYPNANITEAIEFNNLEDGYSSFYLSITDNGHKFILQVSANGDVSYYRN